MFVALTELYMEKGTRPLREGEDRYADRDNYTPRLTPVWVNLALVTDMRLNVTSEYVAKYPERYPQGYPESTRLQGDGQSYLVIETPTAIIALAQAAMRSAQADGK